MEVGGGCLAPGNHHYVPTRPYRQGAYPFAQAPSHPIADDRVAHCLARYESIPVEGALIGKKTQSEQWVGEGAALAVDGGEVAALGQPLLSAHPCPPKA